MQATASDGGRLLLVVQRHGDASCVVYRNGDPIFTAPASPDGIDAAVDLILQAANGGFRKLSE
jgi:hypothetical protein